MIVSLTMLAQATRAKKFILMVNKFENIPNDILSNVDKMGVDESLFLTELEGRYFNALYQIEKQDFNLCGKKVTFLTGNTGKAICNKKRYLGFEKNALESSSSPCHGALYIFNAAQKEKTGGYDAAIVFWTKKWPIYIKQVVRTLKKQHKIDCNVDSINPKFRKRKSEPTISE